MRHAWEPDSPSSGQLQKLPTTASSPLNRTSGRLVSCSQNLSHMVAYLTQVRTVSTIQAIEGSIVFTTQN
jgi:hypothetical protein